MKKFENFITQVIASSATTYVAATSGTDAVAAHVAATQISVIGLSFTFDASNILLIIQQPTAGAETIYHATRRFWSVTGTTVTVTNAAFTGTDKFIVLIAGPANAAASGGVPTPTIPSKIILQDSIYRAARAATTEKDATSVYVAATQLSVIGLGFTFTVDNIEWIEQIPLAGDTTTYLERGDWTVAGTTITVAGATFAGTDEFLVSIRGPARAYDAVTDARKVSPVSRYEADDAGETLRELTGLVAGTTYYMISLSDYRHHSMQFTTVTNVTVKVYYTNDPDATDASTAGWEQDLALGAAGSITTPWMWFRPNSKCSGLLIEVISTGAGTLDWFGYRFN